MKRGLGSRGQGIFDKPDIPKKKGSKVEKYKSTKVSYLKEKKRQISLWLPEDLVQRLKIRAVTQRETISDIIKEALEEKLK
ncbi:hypothetical protein ES705_25205 [subsurface metagenome]